MTAKAKPRVNLLNDSPEPARKTRPRKPREPIPEPTPEHAMEAVPVAEFDDTGDEEFGMESFREDGEVRAVMREFTGDQGISGNTDLTPAQAVLLTQWRVLMQSYPEDVFHLGLGTFPKWFETYRLSINRGSRKESVEILRGNVPLTPPNAPPVNQGRHW